MIANLPLLFAGGNPVSLGKMTAQELELFITFLVHCSWGHDTVTNVQQPPWWPNNIPFTDPFVRPKVIPKDWTNKLCSLVRKCYVYHDSEFLLKFSEELALNPPSTLKYVDNYNSTTSLYHRTSNRLLVTFRNENILYDKKIEGTPRKCLLPRKQNLSEHSPNDEPVIDIYLCDTCDEAFENSEDYQQHEKLCSQRHEELQFGTSEPQPTSIEEIGQNKYFELFGLQTICPSEEIKEITSTEESTPEITLVESNSGKQRRNFLFKRLANLPFSSLAGRRLYSKASNQLESSNRQRDLIEKYCAAPPLSIEDPRWMEIRKYRTYPQKKFKRSDKYWSRTYLFQGQRDRLVLDLDSQLNYLKCKKKLSINVTKLTQEEIAYHLAKRDPIADPLEFVSVDHDDIIDLCSDDEPSDNDVSVSENILPVIDISSSSAASPTDDKLCYPVKLKGLLTNSCVNVTKLQPLQKYHDNFMNSQANSKQVILID